MVIDKVVELYREACGLGVSVSFFISHPNGQESFSLSTWQASQDAAAVPEEDVGREDADRSVAQALLNQLLPRPPLNLQQSLHQHLFRPLLHHLYSPLLPPTYSFKHPNYHLPPTHHLKLLHYQRSHLHLHHHLHCHRLHLQHHLK